MPEGKSDHDMITEMYGVLLGTEGQDGLCRRVSVLEKTVRNIIIILALAAGMGGVGFGIDKLFFR